MPHYMDMVTVWTVSHSKSEYEHINAKYETNRRRSRQTGVLDSRHKSVTVIKKIV